MKPRYELQVRYGRWIKSAYDQYFATKASKIWAVKSQIFAGDFRVVQKQGNKIVKVVYPKESK